MINDQIVCNSLVIPVQEPCPNYAPRGSINISGDHLYIRCLSGTNLIWKIVSISGSPVFG